MWLNDGSIDCYQEWEGFIKEPSDTVQMGFYKETAGHQLAFVYVKCLLVSCSYADRWLSYGSFRREQSKTDP